MAEALHSALNNATPRVRTKTRQEYTYTPVLTVEQVPQEGMSCFLVIVAGKTTAPLVAYVTLWYAYQLPSTAQEEFL